MLVLNEGRGSWRLSADKLITLRGGEMSRNCGRPLGEMFVLAVSIVVVRSGPRHGGMAVRALEAIWRVTRNVARPGHNNGMLSSALMSAWSRRRTIAVKQHRRHWQEDRRVIEAVGHCSSRPDLPGAI